VKPSEDVVAYQTMLDGYSDAIGRFDAAAQNGDPRLSVIALFESLNWAAALDERIAKQWAPDGKLLSWNWRDKLSPEARGVLDGVRFVRNRVHHDWSDAIIAGGRSPDGFVAWIWRGAGDLPAGQPDSHGRDAAYSKHLDGRPVQVCLDVLNGVFQTLASYWRPR
jgi:hypothetical protein